MIKKFTNWFMDSPLMAILYMAFILWVSMRIFEVLYITFKGMSIFK